MTIEELEKDYWKAPTKFPTALIEKVYLLRKKLLSELDANDLRILISQEEGLKYVVPKAIDVLERNFLEQALYYPGDLLLTVLRVDAAYWLDNDEETERLVSILEKSKPGILSADNIDDNIKNDLEKAIDKFI